jgi:TrmH family RNA methyltransferase
MSLPDPITSTANPRVRQAARLREADDRRATGLTLVDGRRELARAATAGVEIVEIFIDADRPAAAEHEAWLAAVAGRGAVVVPLARRPFERIAFGDRNEGVVGVVRFAPRSLDALDTLGIPAGRPVLVVEGVEKPGNLGAIIRTADAAGLAVIVSAGRTDPSNPACIRASLGTVFSVPLAVATTAATLDWCRREGRRVVAATPTAATPWHAARLAGATAILLGSEAHGLSSAWSAAAAAGTIHLDTVALPMHGAADSLNVSATAAVLAYEALRQEIGHHGGSEPRPAAQDPAPR